MKHRKNYSLREVVKVGFSVGFFLSDFRLSRAACFPVSPFIPEILKSLLFVVKAKQIR